MSTPQPLTTISQSYHSSAFTGCVTGINLAPSTSGTSFQAVLSPSTAHSSAYSQVASSTATSIVRVPPPLVPVTSLQVPVNVNPFYVKFIGGNIRVCQGCRGSLRTVEGSVPAAPFDLAIARAERRSFRHSSGDLVTPTRETVCHYHCKPECVQVVEPHFVSSSLKIPPDVLRILSPVHIQHLQSCFNVLR